MLTAAQVAEAGRRPGKRRRLGLYSAQTVYQPLHDTLTEVAGLTRNPDALGLYAGSF